MNSGTGALSRLNSGTWALSGLNLGTGANSGLDGETEALSGLNSGMGELSGLDGGTGALSGLNSGTGAHSGLDGGTWALSGLNSGTGALSPSELHSPWSKTTSPSATVQESELFSVLSLSVSFSLDAVFVAGSRTWTDITSSSGSVVIRGSVMRQWLVRRSGLWLSISCGLGHELHAEGRWWAGHWVSWNHVLWSDETKINLFGSDGVWWQPGEEYKDKSVLPTVKHGG